MKKILLFLSLFFISSVGVNATNGVVNGAYANSQISIPVSAQWYYRSGTEISTTFTPFLSASSCTLGQCNYYSASTSSTDNLLSFNVGQTLETNYLYSLTVYVGSSKNVNLADVPSIVGFGNYNGGAKDSYLNGTCQATVYNYKHSYNIQYNIANYYGVEDGNELINSGAYYWIIKSNCGYPVVNVPVSYASDPGQLRFFGYHIEPLGYANNLSNSDIQQIIDNSNLASSTSVEEVQQSVAQVQEEISNIDNSINNTDTTGSSSTANSFFEGFENDDYGLSDIITMPLDLIKGLTSNTCVALSLTIPFVNKTFELPCMSSIYSQYFGSFFDLYQTVTFGFIAYWVIVKIFALVKGFKDPDDDKVEVMDL